MAGQVGRVVADIAEQFLFKDPIGDVPLRVQDQIVDTTRKKRGLPFFSLSKDDLHPEDRFSIINDLEAKVGNVDDDITVAETPHLFSALDTGLQLPNSVFHRDV